MDEELVYNIIKKYPEVKSRRGIYVIPDNYKETEELNKALNYMFNEWDYAVLTESDYEVNVKNEGG